MVSVSAGMLSAMTAAASAQGSPVPRLTPDVTPAAIRDALVPEERESFEQAYRAALAEAAESLDLTAVLDVLRTYHRIAAQTRHHGRVAHQRMLDTARRIMADGTNADAIPLAEHRGHLQQLLDR